MFVRRFLKDVATLKRPVTAASFAGLVVSTVKPFGIELSATDLAAVMVGAGALGAYVDHFLASKG